MQTTLPTRRLLSILGGLVLCLAVIYGCSKSDDNGNYDVANSLTLFKLDNKNNAVDLQATDTVLSGSGVSGKYILVSGATGASKGLDSIRLKLMSMDDVVLNQQTISHFYKPEYHVLNTQLMIPANHRGEVYKVVVEVLDKTGATVGTSQFFGLDVVSCDPQAACVVNNQITVIVETPAGTPDGPIYLFGSLNGWNRGDAAFELHKNPDVANCYCITVPFPPGVENWQVGEVYVTRGEYSNDATNADGSVYVQSYLSTEMGPIWKLKVAKWRDQ